MEEGDTVRYWEKDGGWRFGHLTRIGRKWATVRVAGRNKEVEIDLLSAWPPARVDTKPTRVKRGRN